MKKGFANGHQLLISIIHKSTDFAAIILGFILSFWFLNGELWPEKNYGLALVLSILIAFWLYPLLGLYRTWRGESKLKEIFIATNCWTINQVTLGVIYYISESSIIYNNDLFIHWYLIGLFLLVIIRFCVRSLLNSYRSRGGNQKHVVVIGSGNIAENIIIKVQASAWTGYNIIGCFGDNTKFHRCKYLGDFNNIESFLNDEVQKIDEIWIALPLSDELAVERILFSLRNVTQTIRYIPDMRGFRLINHSVSDVAGVPVINVSMSPIDGGNRVIKSVEDKILSSLILLFISPILLCLAIGIKVTSPGPVFYRQERISWNGKRFMMLKFRSMPINTESSGVQWGNAKGKTNTKFGQFIRSASLDELPQFINVLKGDMSIVGPRPERSVFVDQFKDEIPGYMQKHMVKAGITGWAQINGWRGDTDLTRRVECDLYYIDNWSLWFDLRIIFLTIFKGIFDKNAC
jgi:putative colanic acid biosynthesis UDP-glucose lipid carrier transferase